jgi:hypothetical protein
MQQRGRFCTGRPRPCEHAILNTPELRERVYAPHGLDEISLPDLPERMTARQLVRLRSVRRSPATTRGRRATSAGSCDPTTPRWN